MRSGAPGVRLGWALAASLVVHLALLAPVRWFRPPMPPVPLSVILPEPETATMLATRLEEAAPPEPVAVPPAPTFERAPSARAAPPRELKGRELNTALAALTQELFYPRAAIERGLEGRVVLLLTLDAAGAVTAVEVAGGSGHALLDDAALKAALRIGRLPGGRRQVLLPVEFRLE
jgi:protein TonB